VLQEAPLSDLDHNSTPPSQRAPWLLLAGAAIGLALATMGLLERREGPRTLAADAAAIVGDRTIRTVDYRRVLAGVENDLRSPVDDAMRRRVLDRMIDEELLVQRALALGLAAIDRRVRGDLTSGLIDSIVSEADAEEPDESAIAKHYEENVDFFTRPGRMRAQTLFFSSRRARGSRAAESSPAAALSSAPPAERARVAAERLMKSTSETEVALIESELADSQVSPIPNALLPASKIRDYVGPTMLQAIEALDVGVWSQPIENGGNYYVARLVEREPPIVPELEEIAALVQKDLKRRRGDEALRRYLDDLRSEIAVSINEAIFPTAAND